MSPIPRLAAAFSLLVLMTANPRPTYASPDVEDQPEASSIREIRGMDPYATVKLRAAHKLALRRLAEQPPCRGLFESTRAVGADVLQAMGFELVSGAACKRGIAATTTIGGSVTRLCRNWLPRLDRQQLATLLIHEGLHQAGMSEWPHDPEGLTSQQINLLVAESCGLK